MSGDVCFIGGPLDGRRASLTRTPPRVDVCGVLYQAITDPDSGEFLGAYFYPEEADR